MAHLPRASGQKPLADEVVLGAMGFEEPWAAALVEGQRLVVFPLPPAMLDLNDPRDQCPGTGLLVMPREAHPDGRASCL
jgi:hypothetical protein